MVFSQLKFIIRYILRYINSVAIFKPGAHLVSNYFCVDNCMCVSAPRLLITSGVMWHDMDSI